MTTAPTIDADTTVADLVTQQPARSRVFEELGIDFCCGGNISLAQAAIDHKLVLEDVLAQLQAVIPTADGERDWSEAPVDELAQHIISEHHEYLRRELPHLSMLVTKVARAHGATRPQLLESRDVFLAMVPEVGNHLITEETELFPMLIDGSYRTATSEQLDKLTSHLVGEHDDTGRAMEQLRELNDNYEIPEFACTSYRAMLDGLERFEVDMHRHVHLENHVLFPRVTAELAAV